MKWGLLGCLIVLAAGATLLVALPGRLDDDAPPAPIAAGDAAVPAAPAPLRGAAVEARGELTRVEGRGTITGTVRRAGRPVAARVELRRVYSVDSGLPRHAQFRGLWNHRLLSAPGITAPAGAESAAKEDGTFRFDAVAAGQYDVVAFAADGARGAATAEILAAGARVEVSVDVDGGDETLSGRVAYSDGTPFRGFVFLSPPNQTWSGWGGSAWSTETDDDGRFRLTGLCAGRMSLNALVPGALLVTGKVVDLPHREELLWTILAGGRVLGGRVLAADRGDPVPGATVVVTGHEIGVMTIRETSTDGTGRFSLTVPGSWLSGTVEAPGFARGSFQAQEADSEVEVRLLRAARVTGTVRAETDGSPVAGVPVFAMQARLDWWGETAATRSDSTGRFALDGLPPGPVAVFALGEGWQSPQVGEVTDQYDPLAVVLLPGETKEIELLVSEGNSAQGRVLDSNRAPVAGALVSASLQQAPNRPRIPQPIASGAAPAATREDGSFVVHGLLADSDYVLNAQAPGLPSGSSAPVHVAQGAVRDVEIVLQAPCSFYVRVRDADGAPVAGARVNASSRPPTGSPSGASATTGPNGLARLGPLAAGPVVVNVQARGFVPGQVSAADACGGDEPVAITLDRGSFVAGRLVPPAGFESRPIYVSLRGPTEGGSRHVGENSPVNPDGTFRFDGLPKGTFEVSAYLSVEERYFRAQAKAASGSEDVSLVMEETPQPVGLTTIRVLTPAGSPVPAGQVRIFRSRGKQDGWSVSHTGLSRGQVRVALGDTQPVLAWVAPSPDTGLGSALRGPLDLPLQDLEIRLPAALTIEGAVHGPDGRALRGVSVEARLAHALLAGVDPGSLRESSTASDERGRFRIGDLGPHEYDLVVHGPPDLLPGTPTRVRAGDRDVRIEMIGGVTATVLVVDEASRPLRGATVDAQPQEQGPDGRGAGDGRSDVTDAEGRAVLRGLDASRKYSLTVAPTGQPQGLNGFQRPDWSPRDETVVLAVPREVSGWVRDRAGNPVPNATVHYQTEGMDREKWQSQRSGAGGVFKIRGLAPGEVTLFARMQSLPASPAVRVQAGERDVALVVDAGPCLKIRVLDWEAGDQASASLVREGETRTAAGSVAVDPGGRAVFHGLGAGETYTLLVGNLRGGRCVLAEGLRPDGGEIAVAARAGKRITGRVRGPTASSLQNPSVWVSLYGVGLGGGQAAADGSFTIEGLPDGLYAVRAWAVQDGRQLQAEAEARAGGSVVLDLRFPER